MTTLAHKAAASRPYFPTQAPPPFCFSPELSSWTIFHLYTMTQCSGSKENLNLIRWPFLEHLETKLNRCAGQGERLTVFQTWENLPFNTKCRGRKEQTTYSILSLLLSTWLMYRSLFFNIVLEGFFNKIFNFITFIFLL